MVNFSSDNYSTSSENFTPVPPEVVVSSMTSKKDDDCIVAVVPQTQSASIESHTEAFQSADLEENRQDGQFEKQPSNHAIDPDCIDLRTSVRARWRLAAVSLVSMMHGISDGAYGALIPFIEVHYGISYSVVSLFFVAQAFGFVASALSLSFLQSRLGFGKLLTLNQICMGLAYIPLSTRAPWAACVALQFMAGYCAGNAIGTGNFFCGKLTQNTFSYGALHGGYAMGAFLGPLLSTTMVGQLGTDWNEFYYVMLGLGAVNIILISTSFWNDKSPKTMEKLAQQKRQQEEKKKGIQEKNAPVLSRCSGEGASPDLSIGERHSESSCHQDQNRTQGGQNLDKKGKQISQFRVVTTALRCHVVTMGAIFIFMYCGAEVTNSGWMVSFLITMRDADKRSIGYVSSGYWIGQVVARLTYPFLSNRIGAKVAIYSFTIVSLVFQILSWTLPGIIAPSVMFCIAGFAAGPIFPLGAEVFMKAMPPHIRLTGMGVISAIGAAGGAVVPFVSGSVAEKFGVWVMHPIAITAEGLMLILWFILTQRFGVARVKK